MGIKVDAKRSDAYIGTFHYESSSDMQQLTELRQMVKNMNKMVKKAGYNYAFYVKLQGRGANRFNRAKEVIRSKYPTISDRAIKHMVAQSLPLATAEYVDAYILRRR